MKQLTITFFLLALFMVACQSDGSTNRDSERIVGTWLYQKDYLGEIEYTADGKAVARAEEDYNYTWNMDEDAGIMTTVDDFTTTQYKYSFSGNDTLNLTITAMKDKNGNEVPHYLDMQFQLVRKE